MLRVTELLGPLRAPGRVVRVEQAVRPVAVPGVADTALVVDVGEAVATAPSIASRTAGLGSSLVIK